MAIEVKTTDEETTELCDAYDEVIAPYSIFRDNSNGLYLILKSIGKGFSKLRAAMLTVKYKFNPEYCAEDDLESTMKITGETLKSGKSSMLRVIISNTDTNEAHSLAAGTFLFTSSDGAVFSGELATNTSIAASGYIVMVFASQEVGSFSVTGSTGAAVSREDGGTISSYLRFETQDNSATLGREAETLAEARERILTETDRQDSLVEMKADIEELPTIYSCDIVFNPSDTVVILDDGSELEPYALLILVTGSPTSELAEIVCSDVVYKTHQVTSEQVVYYENELFIDGKYPVYYGFHQKQQFYLTVYYTYTPDLLSEENAQAGLNTLLSKYSDMTEHIDSVTEPMLYETLSDHNLAGVTLKKVYIQVMENGNLISVPYVDIPKLYLANLKSITYIAKIAGEEE